MQQNVSILRGMAHSVRALFVSTNALEIPQCLLVDDAIDVRTRPLDFRAIDEIELNQPDVVILDAGGDFPAHLQFFYSLRSMTCAWPTPVAALVDPAHKSLILPALDAGIDECFCTSLDPREISARIRALARRSKQVAANGRIHFADLALDPARLKAWRSGRLLSLTSFQFRLLQFLMLHPGKVYSRSDLLRQVWSDELLDEGAVTACVVRLRQALCAAGEADPIRSIRGIGYALDDEAASDLKTAGRCAK